MIVNSQQMPRESITENEFNEIVKKEIKNCNYNFYNVIYAIDWNERIIII